MKKRYLLRFSYTGSYFKACSKTSIVSDVTTVAGTLEFAFKILRDGSFIKAFSPVTISSRTDAGVHALQNTAHVDITSRDGVNGENLKNIIFRINKFCTRKQIPLRVSNISQVSGDFNARRFAVQRSYLYRIGVPKFLDERVTDSLIPISEVHRCYFLRTHRFDVDALREALAIFVGTHDFSCFTGRPSKQLQIRSPVRFIQSFDVYEGRPFMISQYEPCTDNFEFYDFIVRGRSFTYRQVRRMVSVAISVAQGVLTIADLQRMLDFPSECISKFNYVPVAPAYGLHLLQVVYREEDLLVDGVKRCPQKEHLELLHVVDQYKLALESE